MKSVVSVVAVVAAALLGSTAVRAADVEVIHWWTSGGEQAAVSVFAREFDALGGDKWVDTAIAGGMLLDLTDLATKENWGGIIRPASISAACLVDGHW